MTASQPAPPDWTALAETAAALGVPALAAFHPGPDDAPPIGLARPETLVLFGYDGAPTLWRAFAESPEAADGRPDPLDRWSRRQGNALAARFGATALFPFGGPPYQPFFAWALRADAVWPSPLGMLVGARRGLWPSYRFALAFDHRLDAPRTAPSPAPCETCRDQPCRTACPVDAFGQSGYDVDACAAHLESPGGADCRDLGCRARRACPVAPPPPPAQAAFHLAAFRAARKRDAG